MIQTFLSGSVTVHVVWAPIGNNPTTPGAKSMRPPLSQVTVPRPDRTKNTSSTSTSVETPTECSQTPDFHVTLGGKRLDRRGDLATAVLVWTSQGVGGGLAPMRRRIGSWFEIRRVVRLLVLLKTGAKTARSPLTLLPLIPPADTRLPREPERGLASQQFLRHVNACQEPGQGVHGSCDPGRRE